MAKSVQEWIDESEGWQKTYLLQLRQIIQTTVPDAQEALKWGQPCYSRNSLFCYLQRAKKHVTLGFQNGAQLDDPGSILVGEGKQMRHLKFELGTTIDEATCTALIRSAIDLD